MTEEKPPREFWITPEYQCMETGSWLGCEVLTFGPNDFVPSTHVIEYSAYEAEKKRAEEAEAKLKLADDIIRQNMGSSLDEVILWRKP